MMRATFLLSACCALILAAPLARAADPFAGFRIPDHTWQSGTFGFGFSGNRGASSTASLSSSYASRYSSLSTNLDGSLLWGHDSEDLLQTLSLSAYGGPARRTDQSDVESPAAGTANGSRSFSRSSDASVSLSGRLRFHPGSGPLAVDLTANASGSSGHSYSRTDYLEVQPGPSTRTERRNEQRYASDRSTASLRAGAGWGRVRDASALYDAHLIEQRLAETGALARPLSPRARGLLAQLEYAAPRMTNVHERPARFVWAEIERILREDGALSPRGLDAYSVMRAAEGTSLYSRPQRLRGAFAGLGATYETTHESRRWDEVVTQRYYYEDGITSGRSPSHDYERSISDELWIGSWAEWHRSFGWAWQLDAQTSLMRPGRDAHGLDFQSSVALEWFIADRWDLRALAEHGRTWLPLHNHNTSSASDQWSARWDLRLAYYLEDRTAITLSMADAQDHDRASQFDHSYHAGRFSIGLTYRFLGDLDVPSL